MQFFCFYQYNPVPQISIEGVSLVETMRLVNGQIPLLKWHEARVLRSIKELGFDQIENLRLISMLLSCLEESNLKNARVRLEYDAFGHSRIDLVEDDQIGFGLNEQGLKLELNQEDLLPSSGRGLKEGDFSFYRKVWDKAMRNGFDYPLIWNSSLGLAETSIHNIYLVHKDKIYTPSNDSACVQGVLRSYLLEKYSDLIECKSLTFNDLELADYVFVSNAYRGILWVQNVDDRKFEQWPVLEEWINSLNRIG